MLFLTPTTVKAEGADRKLAVTDDRGRLVELPAPAGRIIALYGAFNEILAAMGLEDSIIARTSADSLPPSILDKPSIGTHMRPNQELVVGLGPDLVLQMGGRRQAEAALAPLESRSIPCALFTAHTLAGLYSVIDRLGILTARPDRANELVSRMRARISEVATTSPGRRPTVVFEARYPNLLVAGRTSMVSDIVDKAGGMNPVTLDKKLVRLSEEELLRLDPDLYVVQQGPMNPAPIPVEERPHFSTLKAVRHGRVLHVDEQVFSRPGPRNVQAVRELARALRALGDTEGGS